MVPLPAVAQGLHPLVAREGLVFRGQSCLHTDVYLLQPNAMSPASRSRFDGIMSIRRTGRTTLPGFVRAARLVIEIVGLRGLAPLVRVVAALPEVKARQGAPMSAGPDRLERSVLDLIEKGFGIRFSMIPISEPALALGFDYEDDLGLLLSYHRTRHETPV
jgi:hypothetical protein